MSSGDETYPESTKVAVPTDKEAAVLQMSRSLHTLRMLILIAWMCMHAGPSVRPVLDTLLHLHPHALDSLSGCLRALTGNIFHCLVCTFTSQKLFRLDWSTVTSWMLFLLICC